MLVELEKEKIGKVKRKEKLLKNCHVGIRD